MVQYVSLTDKDQRGYLVTNEHMDIIRDMSRAAHPCKIAAIAGGGEVPLFSLLAADREVFAADLSYASLAAFALKTDFLTEFKTPELKNVLRRGVKYVDGVFQTLASGLPDGLRKHHGFSLDSFLVYNYSRSSRDRPYDALIHIWTSIPERVIDTARDNIGNLTLVHANLRDIGQFGVFDFVYASNAIDNGEYSELKVDDLDDVTGEGGHVLTAARYYCPEYKYKKMLEMSGRTIKTDELDIAHNWTYRLYQKPTCTSRPEASPAQISP